MDYSIEECAEVAERLIAKGATIYQKFTCSHCGTRQTMSEPNVFYTSGICEECKQTTDIAKVGCNYLVHAQGESGMAVLQEMMKQERGGGDDKR